LIDHVSTQQQVEFSLPFVVLIAGLFNLPGIQGGVSGYTGHEIVANLSSVQFVPLNDTGLYQIKIKINVNYSVSDPSLIGQEINAVMKVYSSDGSLLKTTSFPAGFTTNKTGTAQLLTNIPQPIINNITTTTVFMDLNKTSILSNLVKTLPKMPGLMKSSEFTPTVIGNQT
jgi:hypothetical protein